MSLKAVFLDLGNTLLMERESRSQLYCEEGLRFGLETTPAELQDSMDRARAELPRRIGEAFRFSDDWFRAFQWRIFVQELGLDPRHFEALSVRLFARFEDPATFLVYPGARSLLACLRDRGLVLGLISNWSARLTRLVEALGLAASFDFILGSAEVGREKPDPELFRMALERAGVSGSESLHAGDDLDCDVRGALGAGIAPVRVDHLGKFDSSAGAAWPVVGSLGELQELILGRLS